MIRHTAVPDGFETQGILPEQVAAGQFCPRYDRIVQKYEFISVESLNLKEN